jgi:imidazolonepropionase-like amidohydrolase
MRSILLRTRLASPVLACATLLALASCTDGPELVRWPQSPSPSVLIQDVSILNVEDGSIENNQEVLLSGNRIAAITTVGGTAPPPGTRRISGSGATLLPGLIDMHGHVGGSSAPGWLNEFPDPEANLRAFLYCGVTTVLDPAGMQGEAFEQRAAIARGQLLGPRIYSAGPLITTEGGHPIAVMRETMPFWLRWYVGPRFLRAVDSPREAREAIVEIVGLGADVIKVVVDRIPESAPRIKTEVLNAAVAEAKRLGVRAVAHIGTTEDATDAAEAGVAAWMHGVYKERIPDDRIAQLAGYGIPMVPTIAVFESYALLGQEARRPSRLERETVSAEILSAFDRVPDGAQPASLNPYLENLRRQRAAWRDNVRRLRAAGVTILAGSDPQMGVFPGAGLHRELRLLTETGMTPAEAIRAATLDPARFLAHGGDPEFGVIAEGKRADLLLVEGDPTIDVRALSDIRAVIKDGMVLERIPLRS